MNTELQEMCRNANFNTEAAQLLLGRADISEVYRESIYNTPTTLLADAAKYVNIRMVRLLVEFGSDLNQIYDGDQCVLWQMQYNEPDTNDPTEDELRLQITQLLLEYGADPCIKPERNGEDLLSYVMHKIFYDYSQESDYLYRFFILLIAYGAKTEHYSPQIIGAFDRDNMNQYRLAFTDPKASGGYGGIITGESGIIAYV